MTDRMSGQQGPLRSPSGGGRPPGGMPAPGVALRLGRHIARAHALERRAAPAIRVGHAPRPDRQPAATPAIRAPSWPRRRRSRRGLARPSAGRSSRPSWRSSVSSRSAAPASGASPCSARSEPARSPRPRRCSAPWSDRVARAGRARRGVVRARRRGAQPGPGARHAATRRAGVDPGHDPLRP